MRRTSSGCVILSLIRCTMESDGYQIEVVWREIIDIVQRTVAQLVQGTRGASVQSIHVAERQKKDSKKRGEVWKGDGGR